MHTHVRTHSAKNLCIEVELFASTLSHSLTSIDDALQTDLSRPDPVSGVATSLALSSANKSTTERGAESGAHAFMRMRIKIRMRERGRSNIFPRFVSRNITVHSLQLHIHFKDYSK